MSLEHEEYVLGEDVTSAARSRGKGGTAVVSVRLPIEEFSALESLSRATGKTLSQIIREAVGTELEAAQRPVRDDRPMITMSIAGGTFLLQGEPRQWAKAAVAENRPQDFVTT